MLFTTFLAFCPVNKIQCKLFYVFLKCGQCRSHSPMPSSQCVNFQCFVCFSLVPSHVIQWVCCEMNMTCLHFGSVCMQNIACNNFEAVRGHNWEMLREQTADSVVECSSLKHNAPLPVCTTEVYYQCELQPFTEAFSRSQRSSLQCMKLLNYFFMFVFSLHRFQCTQRFYEEK